MTEVLGYQSYAAQGGDYGAVTSARLGHAHSQNFIGIHVNMLIVPPDRQPPPSLMDEERRCYEEQATWLWVETGYQWIQGTKPQTLAYALTDSPVGLAWIAEEFRTWSDCGGDIHSAINRARMPGDICLYWFPARLAPRSGHTMPACTALAHPDRRDCRGADGVLRLPQGDEPPSPIGGEPDLHQPPALDRNAQRRATSRRLSSRRRWPAKSSRPSAPYADRARARLLTRRMAAITRRCTTLRVPVERDHGFRWKMITQSGGT
jgi:hypothetical protein